MKADWDKLMKKHEGSETLLVGDADCEGTGASLCDAVGVEGFPTIRWGSPDDLQDYEGGRDSKSLVNFASKLKPMCSVHNLAACNSKKVSQIKQMQAMSEAELTEFIATVDAELSKETDKHQQITRDLEAKIEDADFEYGEKVKQIQQKGFNFAKAIRFEQFGIKYENKKKSEEEEEGEEGEEAEQEEDIEDGDEDGTDEDEDEKGEEEL